VRSGWRESHSQQQAAIPCANAVPAVWLCLRYEGASEREILMFLAVAVILAVCWALGLFAFHAVGGLIHLLLIVAVVAVVVHFVRGNRVRA
jgi:hypothetical protein